MPSFRAIVAAALLWEGTAAPAVQDLQRAKTKKPRDAYRGPDQGAMSKVLNQHLQTAEHATLPCDKWSLQDLQDFMATVAEHRSDDLQQIYRQTMDRRSIRAESLAEFRAQWSKLNSIVQILSKAPAWALPGLING